MSQDLFSSLDSFDNVATPLVVRESRGRYRLAYEEEVMLAASKVLAARVRGGDILSSPAHIKEFLQVRLSPLQYEVFAVLHLDARNRVIDYVEMFRGTLTHASVHPREVVKDVIRRNTSSVVLTHNHPSGSSQPSRADEALTQHLKSALALIEVGVFDHVVVAGTDLYSFAEHGLL